MNKESIIRGAHERQWIQYTFINQLSAEEFLQIFQGDLVNPQACEEKEISCEKIFLLKKFDNFLYINRFMELLEDEECRTILEEKYHISITGFYKINAQPILNDYSLLEAIQV